MSGGRGWRKSTNGNWRNEERSKVHVLSPGVKKKRLGRIRTYIQAYIKIFVELFFYFVIECLFHVSWVCVVGLFDCSFCCLLGNPLKRFRQCHLHHFTAWIRQHITTFFRKDSFDETERYGELRVVTIVLGYYYELISFPRMKSKNDFSDFF